MIFVAMIQVILQVTRLEGLRLYETDTQGHLPTRAQNRFSWCICQHRRLGHRPLSVLTSTALTPTTLSLEVEFEFVCGKHQKTFSTVQFSQTLSPISSSNVTASIQYFIREDRTVWVEGCHVSAKGLLLRTTTKDCPLHLYQIIHTQICW